MGSALAQLLPDNLTLNVVVDGNARTLNLYKRSPRPDTGFEMRFWTTAGGYALATTNEIPEVRTYRGTVTEEPNTIVIVGVQLDGRADVTAFQGKNYWFELSNYDVSAQLPAGTWSFAGAALRARPAADSSEDSVASEGHIHTDACGCNDVPLPDDLSTLRARAVAPPSSYFPPVGGVKSFEYAVDFNHYKIQNSFGGDWIVAYHWLENFFNIYDHWMCRDTLIQVELANVVIRLDEFYTTDKFAPNSFGQFGVMSSEWKGALLSTPWDAVHMFRTANGYPAGVGGFALGNQIGKDESPWSTDALFHENGHNWNAVHLAYGRGTMGGSRPHHGPFNIERVLKKRFEEIGEGTFEDVAVYPDALHPYAHPDLASTPVNTAVDINVLANDWDANADALSVKSFTTNTVQGGTVSDQGGGVLRYTPAAGYVGKDMVVYEVLDATGLYNSDLIHIEVVDGGLAAHFEFEDATGATASDSSGKGHVGQLQSGGTFDVGTTQGVVGQGVRPPGSGFIFDNRNLMPVPIFPTSNRYPYDSPEMDTGNFFDPMDVDYSVAFWFKTDTLTGTRELIKKEWHTEQKTGFHMSLSSGQISCTIREFVGPVGAKTLVWDDAPLVAGTWYHVALVFDRTAETANIYVDKVAGDSPVNLEPGAFIFNGRQPLLLGANANGLTAFDDARVYTKALSQAEVDALHALAAFPAANPIPASGAINISTNGVTLQWTGDATYDHDVFFGTDAASVAAATTASPEYKGRQTGTSYVSGALNPNATYFWRIDEVTPSSGILGGDTWSFSTEADPGQTFNNNVGWWKFEEGSGPDALDSTGNGHTGTFSGNSRGTIGPAAGHVCFNGVDDTVDLGNGPSISGTSDFTVAAWFKTSVDADQMIVQQRNGYWTGHYKLQVNNDNGVFFNIRSGNTTEISIDANDLGVVDGSWHHAVGVRKGLTSYLYVDGQLLNFQSASSQINMDVAPVTIGGSPDDNNKYFDGCIDEVRIWSRALNGSEIDSLSSAARPVTLEYYHNISGSSLSNLTADPDFPNSPNVTKQSTALATAPGYADNFGARARALFVAPATGNYTFWIASDDASELRVSTDDTEGNASVVSSVPSYSSPQQYDKFGSQQSSAIPMVAGQRYYVEARMKEGGGADHMNVAWSGPGYSQRGLEYPYLEALGSSTSNDPPTWLFDPIQPASVFARQSFSGSVAGMAVDPNPSDSLQYSKSAGPAWLIVASNGAMGGTPSLADVGTNTFTVRVQDNAGLSDTTTLEIVVTCEGILAEYWYGISGGSLASLTSDPDYPANPDETQYFTGGYDAPQNMGSSYGLRTRAVLVAPTTGAYTFWIASDDEGSLKLGEDDTPLYATEIATVPSWSSYLQWNKFAAQQSAVTNLVAGQRYYIEASFKEGGGSDHLTVAWQGPGISQEIVPAQYLKLYIENTPPTFSANPLTLGNGEELQPYSGSLASHISDIDVLDTHTFTKISGPTWLSVAPNGALSGTPTAAELGQNLFVVEVSDNRHGTAQTTVRITVQHSPAEYNTWATGHSVGAGNLDTDGDGWSNLAEFLGGTDPNDGISKIELSDIAETTPGQIRVRWNSQQDGTTGARSYDVYKVDGAYSPSASWEKLAGPIAQTGTLTPYMDSGPATANSLRLYSVMPAGYTGGPADELFAVQRVDLLENRQNIVAFSVDVANNTLAGLLPPDQLPGALTEVGATCLDLWNANNQSFDTRYWVSTDPSFPGWRVSGSFADANSVAVDTAFGASIILRPGVGDQTVFITGSVSATGTQVYTLKTQYNLLSSRFPANTPLSTSGLVGAGFQGSSRFFLSDMVMLYNPVNGEWDSVHWYNSASGQWINMNGGGVSTAVLAPGQPFLILRRNPTDLNWNHARPYTVPLQGP
ncbi:MAG: hypothetical protein ACI9TH_001310 [Kiritimatiellia bacterium]|jgi:hypothetical protein